MGLWSFFSRKGESGFGSRSTAEQVTDGIDASNITAVITGATSGIGMETARVLALRGATVIIAAISQELGEEAKEKIVEQVGDAKIEVMEVDLSSLASVRSFAAAFLSSNKPLNLLMYGRFKAYGQSKLAAILHARELARRLQEEGAKVTANSLHPGAILTNIAQYYIKNMAPLAPLIFILSPFLKTVQQGAATTSYLALHPNLEGVSGKYFSDCNEDQPSAYGRDADLAKRLWEFSEEMTSTKLPQK